MRSKASIGVMLCFVVALCSMNIWAQDEKPKVQRFFVQEIIVEPGNVADFEVGAKEMTAALNKTSFPYAMSVFSRDDNHYFFSFPMETYGDLDKIFEAWSGMVEKWGTENYQALEKRMHGTFKSVNYSVIRYVPRMSYTPENPRLDPMEALFRYWGMCYVKPGKGPEVRKNFIKIVEMCKESNIDTGFETYNVEFGNDTPCYFYSEIGKSEADFWTHAEITNEKFDEEILDLWNETLACFRSYVPTTGRFRPELSHFPENK
jgi:hypothetical protein